MTKFESSVKVIPYGQERVYNKLADLSNLEAIKDRLPEDKVKDISFDTDTLSFSVAPVGQLTLKIIDREPDKCIKFETVNSPLPFNIAPVAVEECKLKITIGMELNPFMKTMVQKPLQEGLEKMADMLSMINY